MKKYFTMFLLIYVLINGGILVIAQSGENFIFIPNKSNFVVYSSPLGRTFLKYEKLAIWNLEKDIKLISSGKRIVNASDDPAGMAVAENMEKIVSSLKQESMNLQDYRNYLSCVDSALAEDLELLKRSRELIIKASSGILSPEDRDIIGGEISELFDQIEMNARITEFNGKKIVQDVTVTSLGLKEVSSLKDLEGSLKAVDSAIDRILKRRGKAGAESNVLTFEIMGKEYYMVNIMESQSRIEDLDMVQQISSLIANGAAIKIKYGIVIKSKK